MPGGGEEDWLLPTTPASKPVPTGPPGTSKRASSETASATEAGACFRSFYFLPFLPSETISPLFFDTVSLVLRLPAVTVATSKRSSTLQLDSNRLPWRLARLEKRPDLFVVVSLLVSPLCNSSLHE